MPRRLARRSAFRATGRPLPSVLEQIPAVPGVESAGIGNLFMEHQGTDRDHRRGRRNRLRAPAVRKRRGQRGFFPRLERRCSEGAPFPSMMAPMLHASQSSTMRWLAACGPAAIQLAEDSNLARASPTSRGTRSQAWWPTCGGRGWSANRSRRCSSRSCRILPRARTFSSEPRRTTQRAMGGALRAAVRRVEKDAPIYGAAPLDEQLGSYLAQRRFQTSLLTGFSVVALLMAAVGIHGLPRLGRDAHTGNRLAHGHGCTGRRYLPDDDW